MAHLRDQRETVKLLQLQEGFMGISGILP